MKRMHALPIEMPLVASGEYDIQKAQFNLDANLKLYDNKILMFIIVDKDTENSFTGTLNIVNIQNKNNPCYCYSSVFSIQTGESTFEPDILFISYDENPADKLYVQSLGGAGDPQPLGTLVIYLYELPVTHKDF